MQSKLENSVAGRALISFMLVVTLAAILATNLPESETRARLYAVAQPYLNATGLDQNWGIFSPNPRSLVVLIESHVDYADGTSTVLPIPSGNGFSAYHDYRWHKYAEEMHTDEFKDMWRPFAEYIADRERADGNEPVRVTLVRRVYELLPPGPGPDQGPSHLEKFFTLETGESA